MKGACRSGSCRLWKRGHYNFNILPYLDINLHNPNHDYHHLYHLHSLHPLYCYFVSACSPSGERDPCPGRPGDGSDVAVRQRGADGWRVQQPADGQPDGAGGGPSLLLPAGAGHPGHLHLGCVLWHRAPDYDKGEDLIV